MNSFLIYFYHKNHQLVIFKVSLRMIKHFFLPEFNTAVRALMACARVCTGHMLLKIRLLIEPKIQESKVTIGTIFEQSHIALRSKKCKNKRKNTTVTVIYLFVTYLASQKLHLNGLFWILCMFMCCFRLEGVRKSLPQICNKRIPKIGTTSPSAFQPKIDL